MAVGNAETLRSGDTALLHGGGTPQTGPAFELRVRVVRVDGLRAVVRARPFDSELKVELSTLRRCTAAEAKAPFKPENWKELTFDERELLGEFWKNFEFMHFVNLEGSWTGIGDLDNGRVKVAAQGLKKRALCLVHPLIVWEDPSGVCRERECQLLPLGMATAKLMMGKHAGADFEIFGHGRGDVPHNNDEILAKGARLHDKQLRDWFLRLQKEYSTGERAATPSRAPDTV